MKQLKHYLTLLFSGLILTQAVEACTNIQIKAQDNSLIVGRTLEFGPDLKSRIMSSPPTKLFKTTREDGSPTMSWTAKYGYLFADFFATGQALDGMNDQGLSFGYLYLPGYTTYPTVNAEHNNRAIPYTFLGDWILGNFSSVDEVKKALPTIYIFATPITVSGNAAVLPAHAIVTEKTGKSLVIEFINGQVKTYNNRLGILTNAPTFGWHITNLQNYANLSPYAPTAFKHDGIVYSGTGQGSGLVGLPGDPTPPSRFIKMAMLQQTAMPVPDALSALILSEHILNNVDVPFGLIRGTKGTPNTEDNLDKTQWTVFKDLTHGIFYFKSYTNPTLQKIDMKKIDWSPQAKQLILPIAGPAIIPDALAPK
ncbi:Choloylglycine hydrolase [Legionella beliardensis]|uniref:Choloylglycine hydrolase n=1 Tax=Legionella beliardensis TaxID=91822 RepID=A0A378HYK5_9GAMM|nr:linear amide C-N hydrolase [Legionella beliardensis]STX27852.1 Choloylglycine hydrolase [Legionella beliardensis]